MDEAFDPQSRQMLERIRAIDFLRQEIDRPRGESASAGLLQALGLSPRPARWMRDVESGLREYLQATWTMFLRSPEPGVEMKHTLGHPSPLLEEIHRLARFEVTDPQYFPAVSKKLHPPKRRGSGTPKKVRDPAWEEARTSFEETFESTPLVALRNKSSEAAHPAAGAVLNSLGPREGEPGREAAFLVLVHAGGSHGCFPIEEARSFLHQLAEFESEGRFNERERALSVLRSLTDALEAGVWICLPLQREMLLVPRPPLTPEDLRKWEFIRGDWRGRPGFLPPQAR